ncbi:hypothetical protein GIB67_032052 [Kingdonia uniflora]|uniref:Alpha N-terminal protein methyltransferase 1 n=1 Tax=Kingdonia uniflora TaxID=39325 RepID=A0A7J7MWG8_9MAGN|nr:hypothetical protein GIB67_032052 [Kingdonia uniflora]
MELGGTDSDGREFKNAEEMWREEIGDQDKKTQWYQRGVGYWEGVEATVDGVLGGYGHVNEPDIKCSEAFLKTLFSELGVATTADRHVVALGIMGLFDKEVSFQDQFEKPDFLFLWFINPSIEIEASENLQSALIRDCGSGIGRVTKNLLVRYFSEVDLVEPVSHFLEAARESLTCMDCTISDNHKAANFYCVPLQEFTPEKGRYDVIWVQWCIGQLSDDDFVSFFKRAKVNLNLFLY